MNFEYLLRKQIRKRILLEFKKRLNEDDAAEESGGPSSEQLIATADSFEEKAQRYTFEEGDYSLNSPDLRSDAGLRALAEKLDELAGNPDEGALSYFSGGRWGGAENLDDVLGEIKCKEDLRTVSAFFSERFGGRDWLESLKTNISGLSGDDKSSLMQDLKNQLERINKTLLYIGDRPITEDDIRQSIEEINEISLSVNPDAHVGPQVLGELTLAIREDRDIRPVIRSISDHYQEIASDLREKAESVEAESNTETETDCSTLESDIGGINSSSVGEYVQKIRKVGAKLMVKLKLYGEGSTRIDTSKTIWDDFQSEWLSIVRVVLGKKHLSSYPVPAFGPDTNKAEDAIGSWNTMSDKLIGDFPSYTRGPRGCLIFLMDAYCGEAKWGKQAAPTRRRRSSSSSGDGDGSSDTPPRQRTVTEDRGQISIQLNQQFNGSRTLRGSGFKVNGQPGANPDRFMANSLRTFITPTTGREGHPGGRITFYFDVDNDKKEITGISVQGGIGKWKGLQGGQSRKVKAALLRAAKNLIFPKKNSGSPYASEEGSFDSRERGRRSRNAIKATFIFEPGYYG